MNRWTILLCFICYSLCADSKFELIPSEPDQIAALSSSEASSLVGGLVSPLNGQFVLNKTDLVARGAQSIALNRTYLPNSVTPLPPPPVPVYQNFHGSKRKRLLSEYRDAMYQYFLNKSESKCHLKIYNKGWDFLPHQFMIVFDSTVRLVLPNGTVLDYSISETKSSLITAPIGICNASGEIPSIANDPRNIRLRRNENEISVYYPDGTKRIYTYAEDLLYLLRKEILPNGKILRYSYDLCKENPNPEKADPSFFNYFKLSLIESLDPCERYVYASITIKGMLPGLLRRLLPADQECFCETNTRETASYHTQNRTWEETFNDKLSDGSHPKMSFCWTSSPILTSVNSPFYRSETLDYNEYLQLCKYFDKDTQCVCTYANSPLRIETLSFPIGQDGSFLPLYTMSYDPPVPGQKGGTTTVTRNDGAKTVYRFSKEILTEAIQFFNPDGQLEKEKLFQWDEHNRLRSVALNDGNGELFYRKNFEKYDPFGNVEIESFIGNLTGCGTQETYTIRRKYSEDHRNLLLREENEEGKIVVFQYLPNTNLPISKFTQENEKILLREFFTYDDCNNLVEKIIDDGVFEEKDNLSGITQRTITRFRLRQEQPFLHMPAWIDEYYYEYGQEKLLKKTQLTYDSRGLVKQEDLYDANDQFAYSITREYDEQGNLLWETNPLNQKTCLQYDEKGRQIASVNFSQRLQKKMVYDQQNRLKSLEEIGDDGIKRITSYKYNSLDQCIEKIDALGRRTSYLYDPMTGETTQTIEPPIISLDDSRLDVITSSTWDALGRKLTQIDPNGHIITTRYNAYGSPIEIIHSDNSQEIFRYSKNGRLCSYTDREGLTTYFKYDLLGRVLEKEFAAEGKKIANELFTYSTFQLLTASDKEGNCTTYEFDGAGRKISEETSKLRTHFKYDSLGRISTINKYGLFLTHYKRDLLNRVLEERIMDEKGNDLYLIQYEYDQDGNQSAITRYPNNNPAKEKFAYDPFGRLIKSWDALDRLTQFSYDEHQIDGLGQRFLTTTITYPNETITKIAYDSHDREIFRQTGNAPGEKKIYDSVGNLLLIQEGSILTRYIYDCANHVAALTRGFGSFEERTTYYRHSPTGRLIEKSLSNGAALTYSYTPFGYPELLTSSDGTVHQKFVYNLNGNLIYASDGIHTVQRSLDINGNVLKETIDGWLTLSKTYDPYNRLLTTTLPDGSSVTYSYNSGHMKSISRGIYSHVYDSYDLAGNLISERMISDLGLSTYVRNHMGQLELLENPFMAQSLKYDSLGRILSISSDGSYEYDERSQLISEQSLQMSRTYKYDSHFNRIQNNELTSKCNSLDEIISSDVNYDTNGNLVQNNGFTYRFDALNRLVEATSSNIQVFFTYDPLGRRLSKTVNGIQEFYLYEGTEELGSFEADGSSKDLKISGLHGRPVALELQGKLFVPVLDHRGNIRQVVDPDTKEVVQSYDYSAFGETLGKTQNSKDGPSNPWRYSAKRFDEELGLYYFGHRYYEPQLARWLTTDPAGFIDGTNLYTYLLNNPLGYIDPDGRFIITICNFLKDIILGGFGTIVTLCGVSPFLAAIGIVVIGIVIVATVYWTYEFVKDVADKIENWCSSASNEPAPLGGSQVALLAAFPTKQDSTVCTENRNSKPISKNYIFSPVTIEILIPNQYPTFESRSI